MIPALIWLLATLDAAFVGFRDAAGRNPHLDKQHFYRHSILRGLWIGQVVIVITCLAIAAAHFAAPDVELTWLAHQQAARDMLWVYGPYAVLAILALLVYAIPDPDISSLATVIVLGPFTTLRPLVIVGGAALTIGWRGVGPATSSVMVASLLMLGLHRFMGLKWRHYDPIEDS